ncbi:MAG: metallophosphoesterase [Clostridia bacterium]
MSLFAIADLHLSFSSQKPMDVFHGWENYTNRIEENWKKLVSKEDTVVIAGDISWAMRLEDCVPDFEYIHRLPGKKLILKGNHDYWWTTKRKMDNFLADNGFDDIEIIHNNAKFVEDIAVCGTRGWMYNSETDEDKKIMNREVGRLEASILEAKKADKKPIVFLHYPPVYDTFISRDIIDTLKKHDIKDCYYGHIHGSMASKKIITGDFEGIDMHLIACDFLKFIPQLVQKG